jgi:hypothetical protein
MWSLLWGCTWLHHLGTEIFVPFGWIVVYLNQDCLEGWYRSSWQGGFAELCQFLCVVVYSPVCE